VILLGKNDKSLTEKNNQTKRKDVIAEIFPILACVKLTRVKEVVLKLELKLRVMIHDLSSLYNGIRIFWYSLHKVNVKN